MTTKAIAQSPIYPLLESRGGQWTTIGGMAIAHGFDAADVEADAARDLALCDASALPKLGIKGPSAIEWLQSRGVAIPANIYDTASLADGGRIARLDANQFLLESGVAAETVPALSDDLGAGHDGVVRVERQEATLLLSGTRATNVFAQTCGVDMRDVQGGRVVMTRIAGASCSIVLWHHHDTPVYQISIDSTYALYAWDTLLEICTELGGRVIGAAALLEGLTAA